MDAITILRDTLCKGSCALLACLPLLGLPACSGGHSKPSQQLQLQELQPDPIFRPEVVAEAVAQGIALPAPSSLSGKVNAASSFDDRLCFGSQWESGLPSNKVADSTFSPQYAGASGRSIADSAYAPLRGAR